MLASSGLPFPVHLCLGILKVISGKGNYSGSYDLAGSGEGISFPKSGNRSFTICLRGRQRAADKSVRPTRAYEPSSRGIFSPSPLLALLCNFGQIHYLPYLNRSKSILEAWLLCDKLNGMIEVARLKNLNAADHFLSRPRWRVAGTISTDGCSSRTGSGEQVGRP
jgi:hypothetical protein